MFSCIVNDIFFSVKLLHNLISPDVFVMLNSFFMSLFILEMKVKWELTMVRLRSVTDKTRANTKCPIQNMAQKGHNTEELQC